MRRAWSVALLSCLMCITEGGIGDDQPTDGVCVGSSSCTRCMGYKASQAGGPAIVRNGQGSPCEMSARLRSLDSVEIYGSMSGGGTNASPQVVVGLGVMTQVLSDMLHNGGVSTDRGKAQVDALNQVREAIKSRTGVMQAEYSSKEAGAAQLASGLSNEARNTVSADSAIQAQSSPALDRLSEQYKRIVAVSQRQYDQFKDDGVHVLVMELGEQQRAADLKASLPSASMRSQGPSILNMLGSYRSESFGSGSQVQKDLAREDVKLKQFIASGQMSKQLQMYAIDSLAVAKQFASMQNPTSDKIARELIGQAESARYNSEGYMHAVRHVVANGNTITTQLGPPEAGTNDVVTRAKSFELLLASGQSRAKAVESASKTGVDSVTIERRANALAASDFLFKAARTSFYSGDFVFGEQLARIGLGFLDVASSVVPGISWARSVYELFTGKDAFTGRTLSPFERTLAAAGALLPIVSKAGSLSVSLIEKTDTALREAEIGAEGASEAARNAAKWAKGPARLRTIQHIFFDKESHNMGVLLKEFGSADAAMNAIEQLTTKQVLAKGVTGVYEEVVVIAGQNVTVTGRVIDGVVRFSNAWIRLPK